MCLIAGYTWLKRELVNWKVNKKILSGMRYKKPKGWKNTEERDIADTMKSTPHFTGIPKEENKEEVTFEEMMAQDFLKLIRSLLSIWLSFHYR